MHFSSLYYFGEWVICFLVYEHACIKDLRCKGARAFEKLKGSRPRVWEDEWIDISRRGDKQKLFYHHPIACVYHFGFYPKRNREP